MDDTGRAPLWRRKAYQWCARYLPAELVGTVFAMVGALFAWRFTNDRAVTAFAATVAEFVGFYGLVVGRELWQRRVVPGAWSVKANRLVLAAIVAEFGAAEILDSLLVRPAAMYVGPLVTGHAAAGALLGKILADLLFYACAIVSYEIVLRRSRLGRVL